MTKRIFNKYLVIIAIVLIAIVGFLKIHSLYFGRAVGDYNYQNIQKVNKNQKNFSFVVFGDNKNSITTFNNMIKKINQEPIAFAIDDGDMVFDGTMEKYKFFLNQIARFKKPLVTVIGNHEIREEGNGTYYNLFGRFYYSFTIGSSYFIVLDDSNEQRIDPWQMDWLKDELNKSKSYQNRFVFMHVPLYDPRYGSQGKGHSLSDQKNAGEINQLLDQYNVTMVFASHIHAYYEGKWQNTPYIITGGGGAELAGTDPKHYFYHYIKVNVKEKQVTYDVVRLNSPDNEILDRWLHDAWIYIYAFIALHYLDISLGILAIYLIIYFVLVNRHTSLKKLKNQDYK